LKKVFLNGIYSYDENLVLKLIDFEKGRISYEKVEEEFKRNYDLIWELQKDVEYKSDGLLTWQDLLRPFSEIIENTKVLGLKRYFETNFFYRTLYFEEKLKIKENKIEEWIENYFKIPNENTKRIIILPSPLLFLEFSENIKLKIICDIMEEIVEAILSKRKGILFFEDPVIVRRDILKEEKNILKKFYKKISSKTEIIIQTYFGKIDKIIDFLFSLDVKGIGIDFIRNEIEKIKNWDKDKILVAGIVDCENSYIEEKKEIEKILNRLKEKVKEIYLSGNCDFVFLPKKIADEKFKLIKNLA